MIYLNKESLCDKNSWKDEDIYVLTDFDRTITIGSSSTSWSVLFKSDEVPKEYKDERQALYDYYRPIEIDESLSYDKRNELMKEWWNKHISLFVKYKLKEDVVLNAANDLRVMSFRKGAKEFLKSMYDRDIPVIIISAGIGNFIKEFLVMNDVYYENIFIVSNFIEFKNGIATGVCGNITHSLNKNEVSLPSSIKSLIKYRKHAIVLGDQVSDVKMVSEDNMEDALKIGFLEENVSENLDIYKRTFDVVCTDNTSFDDLEKEVSVLKM